MYFVQRQAEDSYRMTGLSSAEHIFVELNGNTLMFVSTLLKDKIKYILSIIFYTTYGTACHHLINFPLDGFENIYFILLS